MGFEKGSNIGGFEVGIGAFPIPCSQSLSQRLPSNNSFWMSNDACKVDSPFSFLVHWRKER
jgi:hypothetical protein